MPTQPPHHVSSYEFRNPHPSPEFWILTSGFSPIMRNEPNLGTPASLPARPCPQMRETNPIRTGTVPARRDAPTTRNEPNFSTAHNPITRNEPNLGTAGILPARPCPQLCETNPISTRPLCETNPISRTPPIYNPQYTIYNPLPQSQHGQYAKRTQFAPPSTIHNIQYTIPWPNLPSRQLHTTTFSAKRTQFTPPHDSNARNKPNLAYRWRLAGFPISHYAKRTQSVRARSRRAGMPLPRETNPISSRARLAGAAPVIRSTGRPS